MPLTVPTWTAAFGAGVTVTKSVPSPHASTTNPAAHLVHMAAGTRFSLTDPTWITAIATAVLAAFAIVTAWYARKAFREQSEEVRTLKIQLKDQQDLNTKQTPVLELQAEELQESLNERKREADDRRSAQASLVFVWHDVKHGEDALPDDAIGPGAQNLTIERWPGSAPNTQIWLIVIHVRNTSEQPVYDLVLRWRTGSVDWKGPEQWPLLEPGANEEHTRYAYVPGTEPMNTEQLDAVLEFRDAAAVRWLRRIDGELQEQRP